MGAVAGGVAALRRPDSPGAQVALAQSGRIGGKRMTDEEGTARRRPLVTPVEEAEASGTELDGTYDTIRRELGFGMVPNVFTTLGSSPGTTRGLWEAFRAIMLTGRLPRVVKELVGVAVSRANESEYALRVHLHSLSVLGMSEELLRWLADDPATCPLPPLERAAITFGQAVVQRPRQITAEDLAPLRALGMTEGEIVELAATAALFAMINTLTDALAIPVDGGIA